MRRTCKWDIRKFTDYRIFVAGDSSSSHSLRAHLLLQITNDGEASESFRVTTEGHPLVADIWGKDVTKTASFKDIRFRYEIDAKDIDFRTNTFTSRWEVAPGGPLKLPRIGAASS